METESQKEFGQIFEQNRARLFKIAYSLTGNISSADDLVQETALRAFKFFGRYKHELPFYYWAGQIMRRLFLDECRCNSKKIKAIELDSLLQQDGLQSYDVPDFTFDPAKCIENIQIEEAISAINPLFGEVIRLRYQGYEYAEIARLLKTGMKIGTIRSRLHRARQALQEQLAENKY